MHERRLQNDLNTVMLQHLPFHRPEEACGETISMRTTKCVASGVIVCVVFVWCCVCVCVWCLCIVYVCVSALVLKSVLRTVLYAAPRACVPTARICAIHVCRFLCASPLSRRRDHFTVEQSHVSQSSSASAINLARPTLVFSSHHPEGCYYEHPGTGAREYTVRSVQSGYGGHAMVLDIYEKQRVRAHALSLLWVVLRSGHV